MRSILAFLLARLEPTSKRHAMKDDDQVRSLRLSNSLGFWSFASPHSEMQMSRHAPEFASPQGWLGRNTTRFAITGTNHGFRDNTNSAVLIRVH
jgi:hypothetical protein